MIEVEISTMAAGRVRALETGNRVLPSQNASSDANLAPDSAAATKFAATANEMLTGTLAASEFVHVTAGSSTNFVKRLVSRSPAESIRIEALKPSMVTALLDWVKRVLEQHTEQALNAQARIGPRRATSLRI